jgi:hypothetical protein
LQLCQCLLLTQLATEGAMRQHGFHAVGHVDDACFQQDFITGKPRG